VITVALILASVVAYVLATRHGGSLIGGPSGETIVRYGAIPYEFSHRGQHCAFGLALIDQQRFSAPASKAWSAAQGRNRRRGRPRSRPCSYTQTSST
jgi:hypothetical protein